MVEVAEVTHAIDGVPPHLVTALWPSVVHLVERACAEWPGDRSADDYMAACRASAAQLWMVSLAGKLRAVVITEILNFPQHRILVIELMAGEGMEEWVGELDKVMVEGGRNLGCARIRTGGRKGLTKAAVKLGYRQTAVVLEKDLGDGQR